MDKKNRFLKLEIIILALNFLITTKSNYESPRAFYSLGLMIFIIGLLILRIWVKNEKIEVCLNVMGSIIAVLIYIMESQAVIYFYLAFIDSIHFKTLKLKAVGIITTVLFFFSGVFLHSLEQGLDYRGFFENNIGIIFAYICFGIVVTMIHSRSKDKEKIKYLNKELIEQNKKLKEYSEKVEILTLEKERNRVAQELHDSLGHYLMAISMHLNMLEKIKSEEKKEEIFLKTKGLVKDSIVELRNTVYKLKEEKISLIKSIYELEENLKEKIKFINNIDEEIELEEDKIKRALYITIKESITNGLKHGDGNEFEILIKVDKEKIKFSIKNNGELPRKIEKSNGLLGIEERIEKVGGKVEFESKEKFTIRGEIKKL